MYITAKQQDKFVFVIISTILISTLLVSGNFMFIYTSLEIGNDSIQGLLASRRKSSPQVHHQQLLMHVEHFQLHP
jgi:hypothetical protein